MEFMYKTIEKEKFELEKLETRISRIKLTETEIKMYGGTPYTLEEIRKSYARAIMDYVLEMDMVKADNVEDFLNDCFEIADQWRIKLAENERPKLNLKSPELDLGKEV